VDGYFERLLLIVIFNFGCHFKTRYIFDLPSEDNAYNYYAVSSSWLFSSFRKSGWLSSGKIRANYATVGNDAPWEVFLMYMTNSFDEVLIVFCTDTKTMVT
jgi:hypothetical protein